MKYRRKFLFKAPLLLLIIALLGWIVMSLWNWVMPTLIAGAHPLDYLHAIGLLVLSRILFGGFRGHAGCHSSKHWRHWQQMTQQERDQFRNHLASAARPNEGSGT